mgnify:CR=1 FL=1
MKKQKRLEGVVAEKCVYVKVKDVVVVDWVVVGEMTIEVVMVGVHGICGVHVRKVCLVKAMDEREDEEGPVLLVDLSILVVFDFLHVADG